MSITKASGTKQKILAEIVLLSVLLAFVFVTMAFLVHDRGKRHSLSLAVEQTNRLFHTEIDKEISFFRLAVDGITADPLLRKAMIAGDAKSLQMGASPIFDRLHEGYGVTYLTFIRANRSQILHLEGSERIGRIVDRVDMFDEAESGLLSNGIDLDSFGSVTLRVVAPWRDSKGKLVGFIEFGRDIAPIIDSMHNVLKLDMLVLVHKNLLDRDSWEKGRRLAGHPARSWDELASSVAVIQTMPTVPMPVGLMIEDGSRAQEVSVSYDNARKTYAFLVRPFNDAKHRSIGEIVILKDVTGANTAFRKVFLAFLGGAFIFVVAFLLWVRHSLARQNDY